MTTVDYLLFACFVGLPVLGFLSIIVVAIVQANKKKGKAEEETVEEEEAVEGEASIPQAEFYPAKVLSKRIYKQFSGVRMVKSYFHYLITFQTENGENMELAVPEEYFQALEEGVEGTLVVLNGVFFDFGDGEEIAGKE